MFEHEKELWIELIQTYKELTLLWDPKHKDYANQTLRNKANEKLFEVYKKIDSKGTVSHMKKKMINFRTTYFKEKKKKTLLMENGQDYTPTLWYFNYFNFLDEKLEVPVKRSKPQELYKFNRSDNKLYLEKNTPGGSLKRKRQNVTRFTEILPKNESQETTENDPEEPAEEEENTETTPQALTYQICDILERQTKLVDIVSRIVTKKEEKWEVIGKAIGVQLKNLEETQQIIAHKLISDVIFYGGMGRLTMESFVNVENYGQNTPESNMGDMKEQPEYLEPESPTYLDNE